MTKTRLGKLVAVLGTCASIGGCATAEPHVHLEPGAQVADAVVDLETGSVAQEQAGVTVSVQAAVLPGPRGSIPHPTFWVTVENLREGRIAVIPAQARLIDSFGDQHSPLPISVEGVRARELRYALVDPEIHTYVSLHFGWPYYPIYPYRGWTAPPRFSRIRPWHFDPFWTMGFGPVWIYEIRAPRPPRRVAAPRLDQEEVIYRDARLTYVVVFPELARSVRELRLVIPGIRILDEEDEVRALDFEMIFEQLVEVHTR